MILLDTTIWIRHFREADSDVVQLLSDQQVVTHSFVIGELACGSLADHSRTLSWFHDIDSLPVVPIDEILYFIERYELFSKVIGLVDVQLLAAVKLTTGTFLRTANKKLASIAQTMGLSG